QGRSESHRHRNQVLKPESLSAFDLGTNPPDLLQGWFLVNGSHLRAVVGGVDPVVRQEHPEGVHLAQQATREPARVTLSIMILVDQLTQPGVPGPPLPAC